jgi:hypothetical protein
LCAGWQTQFLMMVLVPRCLSYCLQVLHQNNVFLCKKSHCITVLYIAKKHHVLQPYAFPWRCCQPCIMNKLFTPEFGACSWLPFPTFPSYWELNKEKLPRGSNPNV